jgi:hypothetical protein
MVNCLKLVLNLNKNNNKMNNSPQYALSIGYNDSTIKDPVNMKFLALWVVNHLNWKNHIDQTIAELCGGCYAVR